MEKGDLKKREFTVVCCWEKAHVKVSNQSLPKMKAFENTKQTKQNCLETVPKNEMKTTVGRERGQNYHMHSADQEAARRLGFGQETAGGCCSPADFLGKK